MKYKKYIYFIIILVCFGNLYSKDKSQLQVIEISSPTEYIQQAFDVIHYSATLDFRNAPAKDMIGINTIKLYWLDSPNDNLFYFHLRGLTVDSVKYNDMTAEFDIVDVESSPTYHYAVSPPDNAVQDTAYITIYYHGEMTNADRFGGVFSGNGILYSVGVGFSNNYVSSTQHWLACYDLPSDKATFDFTFITPENMSAASNGILDFETLFEDGNKKYKRTKWESRHKIATNLMTFACGEFVKVETDGFYYPIVIYCRQEDSLACEYVFQKLPEMVTAMQNRFGKYLFDKVGYVITPIAGGAMEHQTMITMSENQIRALYKIRDTINSTALHELSHHWFGNSVTPYDYRDAWFNEGFATFAENTWLEENFGYERYLTGVSSKMDSYISYYSNREGVFPLYDFPRESPSSNYPITIYYKGSAVAAMLRYELGDKIFYAGLTKYLDSLGWGNMTTGGFLQFWEDYTGRELAWFFNQWIYGKGYPVLDIVTYKSKSDIPENYKAEIHISQVQESEWGFYDNLPIEINFAGLDGRNVSRVFKMTNREQVFVIDSLPDFYSPAVNRGKTVRTLLKVNKLTTTIDNGREGIIFDLYPNPAENFVNINIENIQQINQLTISDVTGKLIKRYSINDIQDVLLIELDISDLNCGRYFVTVGSEKLTKSISFIKK